MSARIIEAGALSLSSFHKKYRSSYETSSSSLSSSSSSSPTLPIKRERESQGLDDEGPGMEEEDEAAPEGQSSRSVLEQEGAERESAFRQPTLVTWVDPEDGRVYTDIPTYVPLVAPVQTSPSPEWSLATISVAEDQFLDVGAQLELHRSILHDYTQRLDALPPILFEGYDRDLRKLYTRSGERENHDLRRQLAEERRERLELINRVARMERRHEFGGENACHVALAVLHDALRALVDMLLVAMLIEDVSLVMSTSAYIDSETITQADGAQSSRVPVPLLDDPYVAVRQAQLVDIDTESDPEEAPSEAEESQPLGSRVPLMSEQFEASEPLGTRTVSSHSLVSSDSITPLSPEHPLTYVSPTPTRFLFHRRTARMAVRTQSTLSPGMSARIAEAAALSPSSFCKRYRSSYETPSPSSSLTLPVWTRYRGTYELILDTDSEGDELGEEDIEEDESSDADQERERVMAVLVVDIAASEPLGLGYEAARRRALESTEEIAPSMYEVGQSSRSVPEQEGAERISAFRQPTLVTWVDPEDGRVYTDILTYLPLAAPVQTPPSPEWSLGSLPVSPSSPVVPSSIASPVATPAAAISVDEDQFLDVGAQLELHRSILHDHTQRLDALPPILFEGYDRDLRKLYTRSGERENHDLRRQLAEERRERLELTDHVARIERRHEFGGE
ncbi:hypothetical protein Tco_0707553 [Tanacetum coccineum]|uniref:Uncharacterized protein n=1 Tax=Tanacetum coccineum TaxID=301880 RepID=A0ABQ4YCS1_9ASTR